MERLKGYQKRYLKGLAHGRKPVVFVGQKGLTQEVFKAVDEALGRHELIKVKFIDFKEKDEKKEIASSIEEAVGCETVGMIGHTAIFFRRNSDPEDRRIVLPERAG